MAKIHIIAQIYGYAVCLVTVLALLFTSCTKTHVPEVSYFMVRVDSISIPDSSSQADTLKIKLYGTIGNNGNYAFDHFEANRDSHKLNLAVWGKYTDNDYATQAIVCLGGKEYPVFPLYPASFNINIRQPDSTFLRDSLGVY